MLKHSKLLIVEGIPGVGKSTLIHELMRRHISESKKVRTFLHLTQAHTYGPLAAAEDNHTLTAAENLTHLTNLVSMLKWYSNVLAREKVPKFYGLIDTLHVTHCFRPGVLSWGDVSSVDSELADINCKLIYLKASEDTIWERSIMQREDTQFIRGYARKFGADLAQIYSYFLREQALMEKLVCGSKMKKLILSNDGTVGEILGQAYEFWLN